MAAQWRIVPSELLSLLNIFIVAGITNSPDWPANGLSGYGDDDLFVMAIDSVEMNCGVDDWAE